MISIACGRSRCTSVSSSPVYPRLRGDARDAPRGEEHHHRPPDADQQPVAAGHVGQRERRVLLGVLARLGREGEVDGVLREHGDQGEHGEGEALRHVELEDLGRPGQQEGRAEDGEAEDERRQQIARGRSARPGRSRPGAWPGRQRQGQELTVAAPEPVRGALGGRRGHPSHATGRVSGPSEPRHRLWADDPLTREQRMNSQEQGKNSRSSPCWMRFTGPLSGAESRKHETDDQSLAPIRPLSGRRS